MSRKYTSSDPLSSRIVHAYVLWIKRIRRGWHTQFGGETTQGIIRSQEIYIDAVDEIFWDPRHVGTIEVGGPSWVDRPDRYLLELKVEENRDFLEITML